MRGREREMGLGRGGVGRVLNRRQIEGSERG